jgi:hypothetical protein
MFFEKSLMFFFAFNGNKIIILYNKNIKNLFNPVYFYND